MFFNSPYILIQPRKYARESADLQGFVKMKSKNVGVLFGRLLQRKYPNIENGIEISLEDLLKWSHWPNFIQICSKENCTNVKCNPRQS